MQFVAILAHSRRAFHRGIGMKRRFDPWFLFSLPSIALEAVPVIGLFIVLYAWAAAVDVSAGLQRLRKPKDGR